MTTRRLRSLLVWLAGLTAVLGLAGAGGAWWYHTTRPEYRLRRGQEALRREHWDRAERLAAQLEAAGYADHARLLRGEAFLRRQQYNLAVDQFNQLQDEGELRLEAAALYGQWFLHLKELDKAERLLRYVVAERPDHVDAHRCLAALYYDQGAWVPAVLHLIEVAQLDPHDGRPYRFMGLIYKDLDQMSMAITCYQNALAPERELTEAVVEEVKQELAECLVTQSRYAEALEILDRLGSQVAKVPKLVALRAECLWGIGQASEAQPLLEEALADRPAAPELLRIQARLLLATGKPQEAAALLEKVLEGDRHDFTSRYQLAQAYERLGRRTEAEEQRRLVKQTQDDLTEMTKLVQKAAETPWDAITRRQLADLCQKLNRADLAAMWLRAANACPPSPEVTPQESGPTGRPAKIGIEQ